MSLYTRGSPQPLRINERSSDIIYNNMPELLLPPSSGCTICASRNRRNFPQQLTRDTSVQVRMNFLTEYQKRHGGARGSKRHTMGATKASLSVMISFVMFLLSARCVAYDTKHSATVAFHNYHYNQRKTILSRARLGQENNVFPLRLQWNDWQKNGNPYDNSRNDNNDKNRADVIPKHVAFICDGNSRWAKTRGLPSSAGHAAGADQLVKMLDAIKESGVLYCTMYAFSTENWNRPADEIGELMRIMEECCHRFYDRAMRENVRVRLLGDLNDNRIPTGLQSAFQTLQIDTEKNTATIDEPFTVCFAFNYGGRKDILEAAKLAAQSIAAKELEVEDLDETLFSSFLTTSNIPDPDLIIRTSGERRLSNFLLWDAAYSELYFTDILWPDFNQKSLQDALAWYSQRQRKFGSRNEIQGVPIQNGVTTTHHKS